MARIKSQHKEIMPPGNTFLIRYLNFLSQRDKWWLVFLHVIILLLAFSFIRCNFFSLIVFKENSAEAIIDQRTSNVATIISMTLAVIGLLLSNLAVKDNLTYKLLFVHSRLYLILYYTLSVIACLITISTLRNTLDIDVFRQMVLAGTYLAVFILLGIGYLFRTIINFASANSIEQILSQKLLDEAKENLKTILLSKYSAEMFLELMTRKNITKYTLRMAMGNTQSQNNSTFQKQYQERLIYDINLLQLEKELAKPKQGTALHFTTPLSLNLVTNEYETFIYPNSGQGKESMQLSNCIKTKKKESRINGSDEYKAYFDSKLNEYAKDGKHSKVEGILSYYHELYLLEMRNGI
ncbi:hypothetical protein MTO98_30330 [Mucilaginibacter sp. SMC90]|uniref:hypothetical protein n=1 Tax=Mucilaginibacter sp. SMC90 TaxID=2929803 RepID=UPI001FB2F342|nr:hypothetical protein [Mucilaginibacter sp. SMC90]UOE48700.1 hypothetical protein MTO98_30330 [Mucilaginibacter sp. SMC90]